MGVIYVKEDQERKPVTLVPFYFTRLLSNIEPLLRALSDSSRKGTWAKGPDCSGDPQFTEEEILGNNDPSAAFLDFLSVLGDSVRLKGFDRYKGGLDTVHDLTGTNSIYTQWRGIEIMFHVSTLLPFEQSDPQKVRALTLHIG